MKISIVTPSFNQAAFLEKAILSVWNQKGDFELEHIIADGGSNDGSIEIIEKYDKLYKKNNFKFNVLNFEFKWWSKEDKGQSDALNKGFEASNGDILGWLNSDDLYIDDNSLASIHRTFVSRKTDLVVGNAKFIDEKEKILDNPLLINELDNEKFQKNLNRLYCYDFIVQPSCFFKTNVWEKNKLNTSHYFIMDWEFFLNSYKSGYIFYKIDDFISYYRLHSDAKTVTGGYRKYREAIEIFKKNNTWCLNRFFYYIYLIFIKLLKIKFFNILLSPIFIASKKIRNHIINRYRLF